MNWFQFLIAIFHQVPLLSGVATELERALADGRIDLNEGLNIAEAAAMAAKQVLPNQAAELQLVNDIAEAVEKFIPAWEAQHAKAQADQKAKADAEARANLTGGQGAKADAEAKAVADQKVLDAADDKTTAEVRAFVSGKPGATEAEMESFAKRPLTDAERLEFLG